MLSETTVAACDRAERGAVPQVPADPSSNDAQTDAATSPTTTTTTTNPPPPPVMSSLTASTNTTRHRRNKSANSAVFSMYIKRLGHMNAEQTKAHTTSFIFYFVGGILMLICLFSLTAFLVLSTTNVYNNSIIQILALNENTTRTKLWVNPPIEPLIRVHVFNYTNVYKDNKTKLHVEDLGPYVYREHVEKVDVVFHANNTISYRERRNYTFVPELSNGDPSDYVTVPNVLLNGVYRHIDKTAHELVVVESDDMLTRAKKFIAKVASDATIFSLSFEPRFKNLTVDQFIWGYQDVLLENVKIINTNVPKKIGMLYSRIGVSPEYITIHSGVDDIDKLAIIDRFDGKAAQTIWTTPECNRIDGTDGSQFPPQHLDKVQKLHVFTKAFCRRFPLHFVDEVDILDGIPAYRYQTPLDLFEYDAPNATNRCYCPHGVCPPSGVLDVSDCLDLPILLSYPHFLAGNETLFAQIDGLNPSESVHRSYADIHPRLGFPIGGASRIQINVRMSKEISFRNLGGQILPVIWMELSSGEISDELRGDLYHSTLSVNATERFFLYGSLLLWISSTTMVGILVQKRRARIIARRNAKATALTGHGLMVAAEFQATRTTDHVEPSAPVIT